MSAQDYIEPANDLELKERDRDTILALVEKAIREHERHLVTREEKLKKEGIQKDEEDNRYPDLPGCAMCVEQL